MKGSEVEERIVRGNGTGSEWKRKRSTRSELGNERIVRGIGGERVRVEKRK